MSSFYYVLQKIIKPRLVGGTILELGPGRIWPGLHLLKSNLQLDLKGIGYSSEERTLALAQAKQWNCRERVDYVVADLIKIPLSDRSVDGVVSLGGLHAWQQPAVVFNEIARVLKVGGEFFIGDVRRDTAWWMTLFSGKSHPGLREMYQARKQSLTLAELRTLLVNTQLEQGIIQTVGPDMWVVKR